MNIEVLAHEGGGQDWRINPADGCSTNLYDGDNQASFQQLSPKNAMNGHGGSNAPLHAPQHNVKPQAVP